MDSNPVPEPLRLSELVPCMHIEVRDDRGIRLYHGFVKEVTDDLEPMVILYDEVHCRDMSRFAADMGLKPYASGRWTIQQVTYQFATNRRPSLHRSPAYRVPQEAVTA